jgi:D-aminoacyl-tRNA deacylase
VLPNKIAETLPRCLLDDQGGHRVHDVFSVDCRSPPASRRSFAMIALLQRVLEAGVRVDGSVVGAIGPGLLALIGVRPDDTLESTQRLLDKILGYRIFADERGKMNLSLQQIGGDLLLVPQFTLAADTRGGLRPGFSTAAPPEQARRLFEALLSAARRQHPKVESGVFGADMQVSLINDGPVTFWLEN